MEKRNSSFKSVEAGLAKLNEGSFAMIMDKIALEYQAGGNCEYLMLGDTLTQVRQTSLSA